MKLALFSMYVWNSSTAFSSFRAVASSLVATATSRSPSMDCIIWQAFGGLVHDGEAHGHMKPIEQVLSLGIEIELEVTHGVATIREKRDLLIELVALGL